MKKLVVALGGNAISSPDKKEPLHNKLKKMKQVVRQMRPLLQPKQILFTHGNGSDVGYLLIQQHRAKDEIAPMPLDVLDAMTQGQIGYWLEQTLSSETSVPVISLVTRIQVDAKDSAFKNPSKPIGPFYKKKNHPDMIELPGKGFRRVVASPKPVKILEAKSIRALFKSGHIVIACGGGGIPVVRTRKGWEGVEAVIDKDLAASRLAQLIDANEFLILTNVEGVYLNFDKKRPQPKKLDKMSAKEAEYYLKRGEFGTGSMAPKIEAAIDFLKNGGTKCWIGPWEHPMDILKGKRGTLITT